jgi:uncharacterized protein YbjT (DUF2867 family)
MVLVTGATGNAGGAVVRALLEAGAPVRSLVRPGREGDVASGAEAAAGDLNRPDSVGAALAGVEAVFLLSGYDDLEESLARMRSAGVRRVALLSGSGAPTGDLTNAVARYHILSERAVRESGLDWTFLQPNSFMTNALGWRDQLRAGDVVRLPFAAVPVAMIDPADIAAVAVLALTTGAHAGRVYRLSGPEALRPAEQVATLARALGRDLRFEALTDEQAREQMSATMPAEYADAFMRFFADGDVDETTVLPTVQEVTGRPPRRFAEWAAENADRFSAAA